MGNTSTVMTTRLKVVNCIQRVHDTTNMLALFNLTCSFYTRM